MNYITVPNIPKRPVALAVIDGRVAEKTKEIFESMNINTIETSRHERLYDAISHHPDVVIHHLGEEYIVYAPGTSQEVLEKLRSFGFRLIMGESELGKKYPASIAYNVARVGNIAFHNTNYTDGVLKKEFVRRGVEMVHVNQGYTKCSISIVDNHSIITADMGIAKVAQAKGIDVLVLERNEGIELPGMTYGFIGGSTGLIDKNKWAIFGKIKNIKSASKILEFLNQRSIEIVQLSKENVVDIGSILPIAEA